MWKCTCYTSMNNYSVNDFRRCYPAGARLFDKTYDTPTGNT